MSGEVIVEVKGLAALQQALQHLSEKVGTAGVRQALKEGGAVIAAEMERNAPENIGDPRFPKGFLRGKINVRIKMMRDVLAGTASIGPRANVDYPYFESGAYKLIKTKNGRRKKIGLIGLRTVAAWIEFGTRKMKARPFMSRSFDAAKEQALAKIVETLQEFIKQAAGT